MINNDLITLNVEYINWAEKNLDKLYNVSFFEKKDNFEEQVQSYSKEFVNEFLSIKKEKNRFILIHDDKNLIGMRGLKQVNDECCEIKRMYIRENYRKNGLGWELLTKLVQLGLEMNYKKIRLESSKFMESAHKLYKKAGFNFIDAYPLK